MRRERAEVGEAKMFATVEDEMRWQMRQTASEHGAPVGHRAASTSRDTGRWKNRCVIERRSRLLRRRLLSVATGLGVRLIEMIFGHDSLPEFDVLSD